MTNTFYEEIGEKYGIDKDLVRVVWNHLFGQIRKTMSEGNTAIIDIDDFGLFHVNPKRIKKKLEEGLVSQKYKEHYEKLNNLMLNETLFLNILKTHAINESDNSGDSEDESDSDTTTF